MKRKIYIELTKEWRNLEYCGTKAAGLFELEAMNISVPQFYVIPVTFFKHYCKEIQACPLSDFYKKNIYDCTTYEKCCDCQEIQVVCNESLDINGKYIVRSSAVPQVGIQIEDFASKVSGAFESFIVDGFSKVEEMVLAVWQSVYSESAFEKLRVFHQEFGVEGMAVVVQRYIEPVISGVVHTNQNKINVNWIEGSLEEILQGKTQGREIEIYITNCGEFILRGNEDNIKFVVKSVWKAVFLKLYDWSIKVRNAKHFDQEIEWVYDGENVWVVQSQSLL